RVRGRAQASPAPELRLGGLWQGPPARRPPLRRQADPDVLWWRGWLQAGRRDRRAGGQAHWAREEIRKKAAASVPTETNGPRRSRGGGAVDRSQTKRRNECRGDTDLTIAC